MQATQDKGTWRSFCISYGPPCILFLFNSEALKRGACRLPDTGICANSWDPVSQASLPQIYLLQSLGKIPTNEVLVV